METSKQKAIREAYGEYFEEMKTFINENGWFNKNSFWNNTFSFGVYENIDLLFTHKEDFMIPTIISNIETNNGWIKIESEADLPEESDTYFTYSEVWWEPFYRIDVFTGILKNSFTNGKSCFTHYQPIIKPQPPIY